MDISISPGMNFGMHAKNSEHKHKAKAAERERLETVLRGQFPQADKKQFATLLRVAQKEAHRPSLSHRAKQILEPVLQDLETADNVFGRFLSAIRSREHRTMRRDKAGAKAKGFAQTA